jgi:hypothetical protein
MLGRTTRLPLPSRSRPRCAGSLGCAALRRAAFLSLALVPLSDDRYPMRLPRLRLSKSSRGGAAYGKLHGSGTNHRGCPAFSRSRDPLAYTALLSSYLLRRKETCKPRASCMVTWIIYQPISPLPHVHKLRSQTSRSWEHNTQYTSQHYISPTPHCLQLWARPNPLPTFLPRPTCRRIPLHLTSSLTARATGNSRSLLSNASLKQVTYGNTLTLISSIVYYRSLKSLFDQLQRSTLIDLYQLSLLSMLSCSIIRILATILRKLKNTDA